MTAMTAAMMMTMVRTLPAPLSQRQLHALLVASYHPYHLLFFLCFHRPHHKCTALCTHCAGS